MSDFQNRIANWNREYNHKKYDARIANTLYNAINKAEFRSKQDRQGNQYIRTKARPWDKEGSSTAFGPSQITKRLLQDSKGNETKYMENLSDNSRKFATEVLQPLQANFLKHGRLMKDIMIETFSKAVQNADNRFDYGGGGDFLEKNAEKNKQDYETFSKELAMQHYHYAKGDTEREKMLNAIQLWRDRSVKQDKDYFSEAFKSLSQLPESNNFIADSSNYDYDTARAYGMEPDSTGHWGSVVPLNPWQAKAYKVPEKSYLVLKGAGHDTFHKTVNAEVDRGYKIESRGTGEAKRYFSVPRKRMVAQ